MKTKYQGSIDLTKEQLQDYIISVIVDNIVTENEKLKETIKSLMEEKRKRK